MCALWRRPRGPGVSEAPEPGRRVRLVGFLPDVASADHASSPAVVDDRTLVKAASKLTPVERMLDDLLPKGAKAVNAFFRDNAERLPTEDLIELIRFGRITSKLESHVAADYLDLFNIVLPTYWKKAWDTAGGVSDEALSMWMSDQRDSVVRPMQVRQMETLAECAAMLRQPAAVHMTDAMRAVTLWSIYGLTMQDAKATTRYAISQIPPTMKGHIKVVDKARESVYTRLDDMHREVGLPTPTDEEYRRARRIQRDGIKRRMERANKIMAKEMAQAYDAGQLNAWGEEFYGRYGFYPQPYEERIQQEFERQMEDPFYTMDPGVVPEPVIIQREAWVPSGKPNICITCAALGAADQTVYPGALFPIPPNGEAWAKAAHPGGVRPGWHERCGCGTEIYETTKD